MDPPHIDVSLTNTIAIIGTNFTIYGSNFEGNYQNQSYCDWEDYGSYMAYFIDSTTVICHVPSYAQESTTIIRISNFHTYSLNYTLYSNPTTVDLKKPSNNLMLGEISPYQPICGDKVYLRLSLGSFVNANTSENLCMFGNITTAAYRENSTTGNFFFLKKF